MKVNRVFPGKYLGFSFSFMPMNLTHIIPYFRDEEIDIQKSFDTTVLCGRPIS